MIYGHANILPLQLKIGLLFLLLACVALCVELTRSACDDFAGKLVFTLFAVCWAIFAACILIFT